MDEHGLRMSGPPPTDNIPLDGEDYSKTKGDNPLVAKLPPALQTLIASKSFRTNALAFAFVMVFCLFLYNLFSDGQLSFVFSFGEWIRSFGFGLLLWKVHSQNSAAGVSLRTLELYAIAFFFRFCSVVNSEAYWPTDKTGDFYPIIPFVSFCLVAYLNYMMRFTHKSSYSSEQDQFPIHYLVALMTVLALLLHLNYVNFVIDTMWAFSVYLESVAMLPQLILVTKTRVVEALTSHYIAFFGLDGVMKCIFWISPFFYESPSMSYHDAVHTIIVISQAVNTFLMGDFFYYYLKSLKDGTPMVVPSAVDAV